MIWGEGGDRGRRAAGACVPWPGRGWGGDAGWRGGGWAGDETGGWGAGHMDRWMSRRRAGGDSLWV